MSEATPSPIFERQAPPDDPEILTRRAPLEASTWNAEARTVEVVFSRGAPVQREDWQGTFTEELAIDGYRGGENVPFLDSHRRWGLDDILGSVLSTRIVGGEARAVVRLSRSNPKSQRLADDLSDGIRFPVSVGYSVQRWKETTDVKTGVRTKRAERWTVHEISVVAIPADAKATTRSETMPGENPAPNNPNPTQQAPQQPAPAGGAAPQIETRQAPTPPQDGQNGNTAGGATLTRAETNTQIRTLARSLGLDQRWVDEQIDGERSLDDVRTRALDVVTQRGQGGNVPSQSIQVGNDYTDPEFRARTLGEALYGRLNRSHNLAEAARPYAAMSMLDMARDSLRLRSVPMTGLSTARIVERALHTTSDFPLILGDAVGRTLRDSYRIAGSALRPLGRQVNHVDFRQRSRLMLSEGPKLERLNESGEVKRGTLQESKESYKLETYAKAIGISRQIIVNDDLGAFSDIGRRLGKVAAETEAELLVKLLVENGGGGPRMSDGKNLFHADRKNLAAGAGGASKPSIDSLSAGRTAMRRQTSLQGNPISVTPKWLIVAPEMETAAEQLLADISAATISDANPFASKLQLVVEPRLEDPNAWYLAADPSEVDGLEWSYLEGEEGPQLDTRAGFEIEGVEVKVRLDFGAGFVDSRGWYRNPGKA